MGLLSESDGRPLVIGLGEVLWDLLPGGRQIGGAPANFAYHAGTMGARAAVVSCVGADVAGRDLLAGLDGLAVDRTHVYVDGAHPTGTVDVEVDANGSPFYVIREGVAWDFIPAPPDLLRFVEQSDAICFGTLCQRSPVSRASVRAALQAARPEALRVCDVNLRPPYVNPDVVLHSLELANVVKLNNTELPRICGMLGLAGDEARATTELARRYNLLAVALTRGPHGSLLVRGGEVFAHGGVTTTVVDTVGAGDSFTAAFVMGLLRGDDLGTIAEAANRRAAWVCAHAGATPPPP